MSATATLQCPVDEATETVERPPTAKAVPQRFQPHFMVVPSLACAAECSYCFGPHRGPLMSAETMEATLDFMARIVGETSQRKVKVTFHGGEPLMVGHAIWRQALNGLAVRFGRGRCEIALQSNLWLLDEEFCRLFRQHNVEIGTSLDGPEDITDQQRGKGYFAKTMQGVRRAQACGMKVGCIATFTPASLPRWREVFDFFLNERLGFSIHAAVPPLNGSHPERSRRREEADVFLSPTQYATLLRQMLDYYVDHSRELAVSSLDQMCQGFGCGDGKVCTFRDCLGMFLAIDPNGDIYPCQRFAGRPHYRLGTLANQPALTELMESPVAVRMAARQEEVRKACDGCAHFAYCKGGCPYNAWAAEGPNGADGEAAAKELKERKDTAEGSASLRLLRFLAANPHSSHPSPAIPHSVDPYCSAYREVFDHIQQRVLKEMASEENIAAIAEHPYTGRGHPLLRKGPLIELVREGPHPSHIARTAKRIVAAVELARGPDLPAVATRLVRMGICRSWPSAEASLNMLRRELVLQPDLLSNRRVFELLTIEDSTERVEGMIVAGRRCLNCDVRYLCGGACRARDGEACQHDLDAAPPECCGLRQRATALRVAAFDYLEIESI